MNGSDVVDMALTAKSIVGLLGLGLLVGGAVAVGTGAVGIPGLADEDPVEDGPLETFEDGTDYATYVERGSSVAYGGMATGAAGAEAQVDQAGGDGGATDVEDDVARQQAAATGTPAPAATSAPQATEAGGAGADGDDDRRVATTNVQEGGIDEPDVVKTDGQHFFYAPEGRSAPRPVRPTPEPREDVATTTPAATGTPTLEGGNGDVERVPPGRTHVVDTDDPADPELVERINASGKMLRSGDTLVVIGHDAVLGYDVSDAESPTQTWERPLNSSLVSARAQGEQVYLVTRERADPGSPCPLEPVGPDAPVACSSIHHPAEQIDADVTYTALALDPSSGDVADATSFVGTRDSSVTYMSQDALYVTYTTRTDQMEVTTDYVVNESDLAPDGVKDRIREIRSYDLSQRAERLEIQSTLESWFSSLSDERRIEVQDELSERLDEYVTSQQRELTTTGVVQIGVGDGDLSVDEVGEVPGEPLDQFSMDEHEGSLRVATTVPGMGGTESKNDLYTLDTDDLSIQGSVQNMSPGQRIYSARYVDDTAYLVTFRQVDPFHVIDLSNPANPVERGQVELPGFSDYLHPVGDGMILGVGEEEGEAKLTLFDATDPTDPTVVDSLRLDAGWSAVSQTHHAFLQDSRHDVVFLPAGERGMVVDYTNESLGLEKVVDLEGSAQRARYVNDYLYVFSPAEIAVFDETTWDRETSLDLPGAEPTFREHGHTTTPTPR